MHLPGQLVPAWAVATKKQGTKWLPLSRPSSCGLGKATRAGMSCLTALTLGC